MIDGQESLCAISENFRMLPQGRGRIEFEPSMSLIFSGDVPNAAPLELDPEPVIPRLTRNEKNLRLSIYDL